MTSSTIPCPPSWCGARKTLILLYNWPWRISSPPRDAACATLPRKRWVRRLIKWMQMLQCKLRCKGCFLQNLCGIVYSVIWQAYYSILPTKHKGINNFPWKYLQIKDFDTMSKFLILTYVHIENWNREGLSANSDLGCWWLNVRAFIRGNY